MRIEHLKKTHVRTNFDCGTPELNRYFQEIVSQDVRRRENSCFVLTEDDSDKVLGFYTLSPSAIMRSRLKTLSFSRRIWVPVYLLGKLAVDISCQGRHYGSILVSDAATRCMQAEIQAVGLFATLKHPGLITFYLKNGFTTLSELEVFLPFPKFHSR